MSMVSLDNAREDIAYPVSDLVVHTVDQMPIRSLSRCHRWSARFARFTSSANSYAEIGGEFKPNTTGTLTLSVLLPPEDPLNRYYSRFKIDMLDVVADCLITYSLARIPEIIRLGSGELQVDRIRIHPVDSHHWAFESTVSIALNLLALDLDHLSEEAIRAINHEIASITNEALPGLIQALAHERPGVQKLAVRALERLGTPAALEVLKGYRQSKG